MENSQYDEKIRDLIHEYLLKRGMLKSDEWGKWVNMSTMKRGKDSSFAELFLLEAFSKGQSKLFFQAWRRFLPMHIHDGNNITILKLEFYLRMYFAIYPDHPINKAVRNQETIKKEMADFQKYFETASKEISACPEITPYFALPFVPKPKQHPTFAELYTKEWTEKIKRNLTKVIHRFLPVNGPSAMLHLVQSVPSMAKNPSPEIEELKEKLNEQTEKNSVLVKKEESMKAVLYQSQGKWTSFANDLLKLCFTMVDMVEKQKESKPIDFNNFSELKKKIENYNQFITQYMKDIKEYPENNDVKELVLLNQEAEQNPASFKESMDEEEEKKVLMPLNYNKITDFLKDSENHMKICAMMQALRWRITRSKHGYPRKHVLHSYTINDLLGCEKNEALLISILSSPERK